MTAPKNDKARKAWLAGLKTGDGVAAVDEEGMTIGIGLIEHAYLRDSWRVSGLGFFTLKTGKGSRGHRGAKGHAWLVPLTDEIRKSHEKEPPSRRSGT